jgi:hypothetical protein
MVGSKDPEAIGKWARGDRDLHPGIVQRLRDADQVAEFLMQGEFRQTVQGWFTGLNSQLGDRAPALVIAENPTEVMRAARMLRRDTRPLPRRSHGDRRLETAPGPRRR